METYKKPIILNYNAGRGVIPFAVAIAPIAVTTGFSVAQAAVAAGAAALAGAAVGAAQHYPHGIYFRFDRTEKFFIGII